MVPFFKAATVTLLTLAAVSAGPATITNNNNNNSNVCGCNGTFTIDYDNNTFVKDGQPFRYISGSVHYFRFVEDYWDDILRKLYLAGLNTVQTYVDWSSHQPTPAEEFKFEGNLNLFKFFETAQRNDLLVILRTGPFIDAEWDMGGLPAWLLWQKENMQVRTSDLDFVYFVARWFDYLLPRLKPFLYSNGGPIIMIQVENEYGSYGCDKNYTSFLRDLIRFHLGDDIVLFTTDGSGDGFLKCGVIPGVYPTVDFGTTSLANVMQNFGYQRHYAPKGPLVNSEFYPGWLDHWQSPHSTVSSNAVTSTLTNMLSLGANVNIYMFYGGTSFGFKAGSNAGGDDFQVCPTSYDYDAPLSEAGDPTEKYFAIKRAISKFASVPQENPVMSPKGSLRNIRLAPFGTVLDTKFLAIFANPPVTSSLPLSFENLKVGSGFVLYETRISIKVTDPAVLSAPQLKDRAYIYVDNTPAGILSRSEKIYSIPIFIQKGQKLKILVENQGRVCYGHLISENKGLGSNVTLGGHRLYNWTMWKIGTLDGAKLTKYAAAVIQNAELIPTSLIHGSGFYVGNFSISNTTIWDTFVRLDGWTKGFVWINGFNLGRYWPVVGPQETLYLPAPLLRNGKNTLVVLELERAPAGCWDLSSNNNCLVQFTPTHVVNASTPLTGPRPNGLELTYFGGKIMDDIGRRNYSSSQGPNGISLQLKLKSSVGTIRRSE